MKRNGSLRGKAGNESPWIVDPFATLILGPPKGRVVRVGLNPLLLLDDMPGHSFIVLDPKREGVGIIADKRKPRP